MSDECEHDIDIDTTMTRLRCVKCGLDANVIEIRKLTKELETTKRQLDEAIGVLSDLYFGVHSMYQEISHYEDCDSLIEHPDDDNEFPCDCGIELRFINTTKPAREFLAKLSKEGGEI